MNKFSKCAAAILIAGAGNSYADVLGGSLEATIWNVGYSGGVTEGIVNVDIENDLGFEDQGAFEIAATLEHPVPILPNIRIKHIDLDETQDGSLNVTFDGFVFMNAVKTNFDLTHTDFMLYYEVLDNYVSVDLGLDVKVFDGQLVIEDTDNPASTSTTEIDEVIPLPYVSAEVALPLTDFSFGAEISGVKYSGDTMYDAKARLRKGFGLAFIELGYRQMSVDIEDISGIDVDIDLSGAYLSTGIDF